jgi:hypothetical protein
VESVDCDEWIDGEIKSKLGMDPADELTDEVLAAILDRCDQTASEAALTAPRRGLITQRRVFLDEVGSARRLERIKRADLTPVSIPAGDGPWR